MELPLHDLGGALYSVIPSQEFRASWGGEAVRGEGQKETRRCVELKRQIPTVESVLFLELKVHGN